MAFIDIRTIRDEAARRERERKLREALEAGKLLAPADVPDWCELVNRPFGPVKVYRVTATSPAWPPPTPIEISPGEVRYLGGMTEAEVAALDENDDDEPDEDEEEDEEPMQCDGLADGVIVTAAGFTWVDGPAAATFDMRVCDCGRWVPRTEPDKYDDARRAAGLNVPRPKCWHVDVVLPPAPIQCRSTLEWDREGKTLTLKMVPEEAPRMPQIDMSKMVEEAAEREAEVVEVRGREAVRRIVQRLYPEHRDHEYYASQRAVRRHDSVEFLCSCSGSIKVTDRDVAAELFRMANEERADSKIPQCYVCRTHGPVMSAREGEAELCQVCLHDRCKQLNSARADALDRERELTRRYAETREQCELHRRHLCWVAQAAIEYMNTRAKGSALEVEKIERRLRDAIKLATTTPSECGC